MLLWICLLPLSLVGVSFLLYRLICWLRSDGRQEAVLLVLPLRGAVPDVEVRLKRMITQNKAALRHECSRLLCIDLGIDAETRKICEILCSEYSFANLILPTQLEKLI